MFAQFLSPPAHPVFVGAVAVAPPPAHQAFVGVFAPPPGACLPRLRCKESADSGVTLSHSDDYFAHSIDEIAAQQGINIRRRPSTGPSMHAVGPFEFRLENEGNTPRNILEKIVWDKDIEVRQVEIANAYQINGAACLSVLTDEKYFQGSFENLEAIRTAGVLCPLLCKEFIIDVWQIYYARTKGADAILLIAAVLPDSDIKYMTKICRMLGLAVLVEVHNEREMDRVLGIDGIQLIGINNRNLETFEVDITNTKKLLEGERGEFIRQKDILVVGESGLFVPDDVAYVQGAGVRAVLVGESLIKQTDPGKAIGGLFGKDISV